MLTTPPPELLQLAALTLGVGWASGINVYATVLLLGLMGSSGHLDLPPDLAILQHPLVIAAAGVMYAVEFLADKIPAVDSLWDVLHTFVRIPAGAALAAGSVGQFDPAVVAAAALLGGGLATGMHATKAGSRLLINASPEPFSNWAASLGEDAAVFGGLWIALQHPWVFLGLLALLLLVLVWLLPRIWRGIVLLLARIGRLFGRGAAPAG